MSRPEYPLRTPMRNPDSPRRRRGRTCLGVGLLLAVLSGCAFVRGQAGEVFSQQDVEAIRKGVTTKAEVATRLGAPDAIVEAGGREIFHYRRYDGKLGYLLIFSRLNVKSDNLFVFFDNHGVVEEVVFGK
ncbi:MAG: outer membrane protein assembly factor BamE domain-containing protein, partial [Nitrospirales bacterium]